jgi:hypothetical protein
MVSLRPLRHPLPHAVASAMTKIHRRFASFCFFMRTSMRKFRDLLGIVLNN